MACGSALPTRLLTGPACLRRKKSFRPSRQLHRNRPGFSYRLSIWLWRSATDSACSHAPVPQFLADTCRGWPLHMAPFMQHNAWHLADKARAQVEALTHGLEAQTKRREEERRQADKAATVQKVTPHCHAVQLQHCKDDTQSSAHLHVTIMMGPHAAWKSTPLQCNMIACKHCPAACPKHDAMHSPMVSHAHAATPWAVSGHAADAGCGQTAGAARAGHSGDAQSAGSHSSDQSAHRSLQPAAEASSA